jgi:haloalkane dehalogenase
MGDTFKRWLAFSQTAPDLPVGEIVRMGCVRDMSDEVVSLYEAPYGGFDEALLEAQGLDAKAAARRFPALVPVTPGMAGAGQNRRAWQVLQRYQRPWLCAFSDGDPITAGADAVIRSVVPGTRAPGVAHTTIKNAGHFLQEDAGEEVASVLRNFILSTSRECSTLVDGPALALQRQSKL